MEVHAVHSLCFWGGTRLALCCELRGRVVVWLLRRFGQLSF